MGLRRIAVVTTARSDFGLLTPLIRILAASKRCETVLFAGGQHHSTRHGETIEEVRGAGLGVELVELPAAPSDDRPSSLAAAMGKTVARFGEAYAQRLPDLVVALGDRYDMLPAVVATVPFNLPVGHISGGEITEGAIDDSIRHAVTKLSHLHFVSTAEAADRVAQLGEEGWRIHVTGQPGLDQIETTATVRPEKLCTELGLNPEIPVTILTFHPESLRPQAAGPDMRLLLDVARQMDCQTLVTYPNSDPGSDAILSEIERACRTDSRLRTVRSLGRARYHSLLRFARCMVGNSSSGVIESASFKIPAVDIGSRQKGRLAPPNVIQVAMTPDAVGGAWRRALSDEFRNAIRDNVNPYGDGRACERIAAVLLDTPLDRRLLEKKFVNVAPLSRSESPREGR